MLYFKWTQTFEGVADKINPVLGGAGSTKATVRYSSINMLTALGQSGTSERRYRVARTKVLAARFFICGDPNELKKVFKK